MDISLFFTLAMQMSFVTYFESNSEVYQDYFIFNRGSDVAHLFRENYTIQLILDDEHSFHHFKVEQSNHIFKFEWPCYIDDNIMVHDKSYGEINFTSYDNYLFIDPIPGIEIAPLKTSVSEISYEIIALMLTILAIIIKLPDIIPYLRTTQASHVTRESWV